MKKEISTCSCEEGGCGCAARPNWIFFALVLVVMFGGFYFLSTIKTASNPNLYLSVNGSAPLPEYKTISVSGSATEKVEPDMLTVTFLVNTKSDSAKDAQSKNAEIVSNILSSLKALGVSEKDIKTTSYSVNVNRESHYICQNESNKSDCYWIEVDVGYVVIHSFTVNIYDLNKGGAVVDAIGKSGGEVDAISFDLKPETRKEVIARLLAVAAADAKKKADAIANGIGVSVVGPRTISESYSYTPIYSSKSMFEGVPASVPTVLESGTMVISVSVSATFEMK